MHGGGILAAADIIVDILHGAGTEQGDDGGDILDAPGLQAHGHIRHAGAFHLEHAGGLPLAQHLENGGIVIIQMLPVQLSAVRQDHFPGVVQNGQVAQAQKVHLQKAQLLQRGHHILADHALIASGQGDIFVHRRGGNDHARRMGGAVAGHALDLPGHVQQVFHPGIVVIIALQLRRDLQRLFQRHFQLLGHQLCHHVHLGIGHAHDPAHIPDHSR